MTTFQMTGDSGRVYTVHGDQPVAVGRVSMILLARDPDGVTVCVKRFFESPRTEDRPGLESFRREVSAHRVLTHPNIISIVDVGLDESRGLPFRVRRCAHRLQLLGPQERRWHAHEDLYKKRPHGLHHQ